MLGLELYESGCALCSALGLSSPAPALILFLGPLLLLVAVD